MKSIIFALTFIFYSFLAITQTLPYGTSPDWESAPSGHIATGLGLADINGDGWKDLVVANGNDIERQHLVVYYNEGDGSFPLNPDWESNDIDYHGHLSVGDINKDGWPDVAVSVYIGAAGFGDPGKVKVYYNQGGELEGTPSFESHEYYTFSCALGDADGDGDLDLATTGGEPYSSLYDLGKVFINRNGTFSQNPEWESSLAFGSLDVEFGDVDQNGFLDLIFTSEETPNYIFLADSNGSISTSPAWQSQETSNYINSVDFGFTGTNHAPSIVMTGNNQLGGDGKVRLYQFATGVPPTSSAGWLSNVFGNGSGILLARIDNDDLPDLVYGGWWLPVKIALGTSDGFETNTSYTSATNSVVEAIQMADLDQDGLMTTVETFNIDQDGILIVYLAEPLIEKINSVMLNGLVVSPAFYCYVENKNWISFKDRLLVGDVVTVNYDYSTKPDIVVTNWDSNKGNYIFYNNSTTGTDTKTNENLKVPLTVIPNPASGSIHINFTLPQMQLVSITLTDLSGQTLVKTYRKWLEKGRNSVDLDTPGLNPAVYILRFNTLNSAEIRKVIIK